MSVAAIIPVRSLSDGKTRLAPVPHGAERYKLNARFLSHALHIASALTENPVVVTNDQIDQYMRDNNC